MWNSEILLKKLYRATEGEPRDDDLEVSAALNDFMQPTPGAQSMVDFIEGAGQNTVNAMVDDVLEQIDEPQQKRRRSGPLASVFPEETSAAGSSAAGSSAAGSSADSYMIPPNIVETSNFTFTSSELASKFRKDDLELKEYLIEYFKHLLKTIKRPEDISWSIVTILKKKKTIDMFGSELKFSSEKAVNAGGEYFSDFIKVLETITKQ